VFFYIRRSSAIDHPSDQAFSGAWLAFRIRHPGPGQESPEAFTNRDLRFSGISGFTGDISDAILCHRVYHGQGMTEHGIAPRSGPAFCRMTLEKNA